MNVREGVAVREVHYSLFPVEYSVFPVRGVIITQSYRLSLAVDIVRLGYVLVH
jgi:hypothetical protein